MDVIVNNAFGNLDLKLGAVSSALLKEAGDGLQVECKRKYPEGIVFPEIAVTKGYKLPCQFVFHGSLPKDNRNDVSITC